MDDLHDLHDLFTHAEEEPMTLDLSALHDLSATHDRTIRRRNLREIVVGCLLLVLFGGWATAAPTWTLAIGPALLGLGVVAVIVAFVRHGEGPRVDPALPTSAFLQRWRTQLEHQAELLETAWRWYVGPLVPGMAWVVVAYGEGGVRLVTLAFIATVAAGVIAVNLYAARDLRRQAADVPELD